MTIFQRVPKIIAAERYGSREAGEWYKGCDQVIARFLLGLEPSPELLSGFEIYRVLRPQSVWDPPSECVLTIMGVFGHASLKLGDWVIRDGTEIYTMYHSEFSELYEEV